MTDDLIPFNMNETSDIKKTGALDADKPGMTATAADLANQTMSAARARLKNAIARGEELTADLRTAMKDPLKNAEGMVRKYPYQSIAVAAGIGTLLGLLAVRSFRRERE